MDEVISVILGGGAGSRLNPLTMHRSKPAVPLAGKYRLIDIPISNCINSNIDRIFVLTQFNSASLNRHISRSYQFDRFRNGFVNILAAEQTPLSKDWFQGTADAVRQSMLHLTSYRYDYVLVLSGDQLYSMDYRKMLAHHKESDAMITIASIPVTAEEAPGFGILKTDEDHVITEFHEKPPTDELDGKESPVSPAMKSAGRTFLASMGIYVFNQGVLRDLLDDHPNAHDFGKEIIPSAIDTMRVVSYPFDGYWSDIGTIRSFYEANLMLAKEEPDFDMFNPKMPLYTNARMLAPAKVQNSRISRSIVAEACVIVDAEISNSVIGIRSFVDHGAIVRNTVFMGADYYPWTDPEIREIKNGPDKPGIGADSRVENAIIDRNVSIGEGCVITNEAGVVETEQDNYYIRDGVVVVPKNVSIPPGTTI
ncbi:MAG: glucose-1-phosphate adenylyltransferase [Rhodothermales bacterium]|nr:glucose-1-phosphate adenylyltransferase [Rhodothermales bacterium]